MKKSIFFLVFINCFFSFGQAVKKDKITQATIVYGYFTGIETTLQNIIELNPELDLEIKKLKFLLATNFGQSKKNAIKYLNNYPNWEDKIQFEIDSIKKNIYNSILFSTNEEISDYLKELEKNLNGSLPSPILECILYFEYENNPSKEFSNGYTYSYSTKNHIKSKNSELIIYIPKSWSSQEGKQPNVIQLFTSDCGYGLNNIAILTKEMSLNDEFFNNLSFDEVDKFYEELFDEEYARNFIDGKFISFKTMKIAGRSGFLINYEFVKEKMGTKLKSRNSLYVFHDITCLHVINCNISTIDIFENLDKKFTLLNPLFFMIVNSIVVPNKNEDIIELKGTNHQKIIEIKISENSFDFIFDTGATTSLVSKSIINNLLAYGVISNRNFLEKKSIVTADGKKHLVEFWNLPQIVIDGKKINDVDFAVMEGDIVPLLGMNIINKLNIYKIDLVNNKIYLNK